MAGIRVGTVKMIEKNFLFNDQSRFFKYNHKDENDSSSSQSISYSESLPSRESSVDLTPDVRIISMLKKKHECVQELTERLRKFDHFSCFFALSGLLFSIISCELGEEQYELIQILRMLCVVCTVNLGFCIFMSWKVYYCINREKKIGIVEGCTKTFRSNWTGKVMVFEIMFYAIQPLPFADYTFKAYQLNGLLTIRLSEILTSFMLLRVFICLKLFRHHSKWTNEHSSAVCDLYAAKATELYALKALLIEKPVELLVPLLLLSTIILSLALRIYERNFESDSVAQDYSYIWNAMWLILLTMTTAGFGDFYPKTHPGRFIAALSAYWGIFLFSIIILTLTNFSHLNPAQQRSFNLIKRLQLRKQSKSFACAYIISMLETLISNSKSKVPSKSNIRNLIKIKSNFKDFKKFQRFYIQVEKTPGELLRIINEKLRIEIENLENKIREAKDLHSQLENIVYSQDNSIELLKEAKKYVREILISPGKHEVIKVEDL